MTTFQQIALILILIWFLIIIVRFHRSTIVLIVGLFIIGLYTLVALVLGRVTTGELGLDIPKSWLLTIGLSLAGLVVTLSYSPLANWIASRWFPKPPNLEAFRSIQKSKIKLIAGIIIAWVLGGILEELIARGIFLLSVKSFLTTWISEPTAAGIAICIAALGAGLMHFYQGPRAMVIITQLSVLFGVLFVVSGYNLWTVILCHGLYDTIAFVRFANNKSRYANSAKI